MPPACTLSFSAFCVARNGFPSFPPVGIIPFSGFPKTCGSFVSCGFFFRFPFSPISRSWVLVFVLLFFFFFFFFCFPLCVLLLISIHSLDRAFPLALRYTVPRLISSFSTSPNIRAFFHQCSLSFLVNTVSFFGTSIRGILLLILRTFCFDFSDVSFHRSIFSFWLHMVSILGKLEKGTLDSSLDLVPFLCLGRCVPSFAC